ncbi:hypothetical protein D0T56_15855 [Dysgonomonas sp. 520]|nr:hypothetical protein [Dysgonomonas sp. 520]
MLNVITVSFVFCFCIKNISAQEANDFKPSGKIIARAFLDYSAGFGEADESGFDITRAFLGYNYRITPTLSGQVIIDAAAGRTSSGSLETHLRNAFVQWKDKGFTVNVGQIGLLQFSTQEKYWKHRYIMKSFQDLNKMAPSVDLGATVQYEFNKMVSADVSFTNGEGYKKLSRNNSNRYAAGINISPANNILFRLYGDIYTDSDDIRESAPESSVNVGFEDQKTLSFFAGYQDKKVSGGLEFNKVWNKGMVKGKDYYGYSAYASVEVAPKWRVFARYDLMDSHKPSNFSSEWNSLDGQIVMGGIEFIPLKQIKIAPNFRNINPKRAGSEQYIFVNLEINL